MNIPIPETQYYFDIVKETAAEYVVRALNGRLHRLNKRVLRNADQNFKALLHPETRVEEPPPCIRDFITAFAGAALAFAFPDREFNELRLSGYEPSELHTGSWSSDFRRRLLREGQNGTADKRVFFDVCARFSCAGEKTLLCNFECDTRSREDQFARLIRYLACSMAGSLVAGLDDYRHQVPCLPLSISSTSNVVRFKEGQESIVNAPGIYLIGTALRTGCGWINSGCNTIMFIIIQLPDVAEFLTRKLKDSPGVNLFENLPPVFRFAAWFCGLTELDRLLESYPLFKELKENEMHAIETDKDTVADYSAFDWKTQQSLRVKDREIAMRDAKINSQKAEIVSQQAEIVSQQAEIVSQQAEIVSQQAEINSQQAEIVSQKAEINRLEREQRQNVIRMLELLQGRSDREIMELLHWTPAELEKYRTLAEL